MHARSLPGCAPPPGQHYEARLTKSLLPLIRLEHLNAVAQRLTHDASAVFKTVEHK